MKKIKYWFIHKFFNVGYRYAYNEVREYMKEIYRSPTWEDDVWKFVDEKV